MPKQRSSTWIEDKLIGTSAGAIVVALWNIASTVLHLDFKIWKYGLIGTTVLAIVGLILNTWPWTMLDDLLRNRGNRYVRLALIVGASLLFFIATLALYANIVWFRHR